MNIYLNNDFLKVKLSSEAGHINQIYNKKTNCDYYWKYDSSVWPRRTSICFPICGNLPEDTYIYENTPYMLPMHGFLRESELMLISHDPISASFLLTSDETTIKNYPFYFRFIVLYELEANTLIVRYIIKNTGLKAMYYSVGAHYTYRVPIHMKQSYKNYQLSFNGVQKAGKLIINNNLVSGITQDIFNGRDHLPLDGLFNNGSIILNTSDLTSGNIVLESKNSESKTRVSFDGFSYVVLWAPFDGAPFVCIEPWAGMLNKAEEDKNIEHKLGIVELEPGGTRTYAQRITVT